MQQLKELASFTNPPPSPPTLKTCSSPEKSSDISLKLTRKSSQSDFDSCENTHLLFEKKQEKCMKKLSFKNSENIKLMFTDLKSKVEEI